METPSLSFLMQADVIGRRLIEKLGASSTRNTPEAQLFTELGREIVDIAEDVNTYLVILNHSLSNVSQSSLDATTHKNLLKQFTNSANDTAGSITAITAFLLSAGDVKKDSRVQSLLASTHDAGSFLKGSQMKFTSLSSCRDQARQARHDLAGAFKLTAYASALGSKYEDVDEMIHKYCRSSQSTSVVQSLVKLHNVLPFSSGGPQFEPSLIKNEQDADQIASANTSDGVNHLALAMTPEGNRWLSDCSPNATAEFMIQKQGQLATLFWTSLLEQARKVQSQDNEPAFRNLEAALRRSVTRLTNPSLRVAVVGVVKAGKSTFINSIIGQAILPAATQAATAWPCRIRHERGRMTPVLTCNPEPFNKALSAIREAGISPSKLAKCTDTQGPPKENGPAAKLEEWKEIWLNLPRYVQENTKLYEGGWVLKSTASGVDEIGSLLADINDIYRLCVRFGILFNEMQASNSWPVIHVHFKSLPDEENVQFEFIDVPGTEESMSKESFLHTVGKAIAQSDAVVAVVNGLQLETEHWRRMPSTIDLARPGRPVDLVVCTHLDGLSQTPLELERDIQTRKDQIARVFGIDNSNIVMATPVWGLGAHVLLSQTTNETKPEFDFNDGRFDLEIKCINAACGNERIYKRSPPDEVKQDFEDLYTRSKILGVITTIRTKVLLESRSKRTLDDMNDISPYIGRLVAVQNQRLKLARTEQEELERMTREFGADKSMIQSALDEWGREEYSFISSARDKVEAKLHALLYPPSRSIVGEAAREVRDEWQNRGLKIKMNPDRVWQFEDRSRNDLDAKVTKFFDELRTRVKSRFEDELLPIVQEACREAGDAPLRKLKANLNALKLSSGYRELKFNLTGTEVSGISDEFELGVNNTYYEDHRYGMNWKDAALWGTMLAVAPVMAPFAVVGSLLRTAFRKDKTILSEDQTINGLQAGMEEVLSQAMPKVRSAVEDAVRAAFRAGAASVERDLERRQSLFEGEAAKRETRTSSEIAEMLIVYSNLVSGKTAAEGLLKCLQTGGTTTPGVVPSIKTSMKH